MKQKNLRMTSGDRLTITLGKGHRAALQSIAHKNHASLAFVTRYALEQFIHENKGKLLDLERAQGKTHEA